MPFFILSFFTIIIYLIYSNYVRIKPLDGVFEIHITVDHEKNNKIYFNLISWARKYGKVKIIYAVSLSGNNQYMISYFTRKTNEDDAIKTANQLADEIKGYGMDVLRIKVESHSANNTPMTNLEYDMFSRFLKNKYKVSKPYFEFHVKISDNYDYEKLETIVKDFEGVAVSYNLCSKNRLPLLTIRVYNLGFILAQKYKDDVLDKMKNMGYKFESAIQQEFSIYDTNPDLDKSWLVGKR